MSSQFIIKNFMRKSAVVAIIIYPDKRVRILYTIPKGNIISIKGHDLSFVVNDKDFFLYNGLPAFIYDINNVQPKNPYNEGDKQELTPFDFDTAISSRVAKEILEATSGKMDKLSIVLIMSFITLGGIAILGYYLGDQLKAIMEKLIEIYQFMGGN